MARRVLRRLAMIVAAMAMGSVASGCVTNTGAKPVVVKMKPVTVKAKVQRTKSVPRAPRPGRNY